MKLPFAERKNEVNPANVPTKRSLTLLSRSYCHLCEEMAVALLPLLEAFGVPVSVVDVDTDTDLLHLYDEKVPVLIGTTEQGASIELCHYFLDEVAVRAFLAGEPAGQQL